MKKLLLVLLAVSLGTQVIAHTGYDRYANANTNTKPSIKAPEKGEYVPGRIY